MKFENVEELIPFMRDWETGHLEDAFIAFCVDAIESQEKVSSWVYKLVSSVNDSWFTDDVRLLVYKTIRKTILSLGKEDFVMPGSIAIKADAIIQVGLVKTNLRAADVIDRARSSSGLFLGAYSYDILVNSVIPLWRIKLARRHLRNCSETIVDSLDSPPSHDLLTKRIPALIEKQQNIWGHASTDRSKDGGWSDTIDELLRPIPDDNSVSTGIDVLDKTIQGGIAGPGSAYGGRLIVIAARPGMGKTTLAVTLATHLADTGNNVVFFSLEMPRKQIEYKSICCLDFLQMKATGKIVDPIRLYQLQQRSCNMQQRERLKAIKSSTFAKMFDILDAGQDINQIVATIRMVARTRPGLRGIFIDYLHLIDGCTGTDNDSAAIGKVTASLKRVAKEVGIDIILLSQINRGVEQRSEKMPNLADLRGSGCIEQDADIVIFLFRPGYYDQEMDPYELAISVAKNRNGVTGILGCKIDLVSSVVFDRL
ncbi:MAG: DnaB-like helicase C-terminal domain-containing protein [Bacteroidota bacterium]|jgi:replicative DNA helicase